MWLKEWRRRYFALKGNKLHFAKSPGVRARGAPPVARGRRLTYLPSAGRSPRHH